jgi:FAD/FMN-containing dehydrogenase/Fe-S oxidoreductase
VAEVAASLLAAGVRDLDSSSRRLSEYSSDASNYRVRPLVVVRPQDADEVVAVVAVARELGVPVTPRGGGTSIAGNAIGPGIVLDLARMAAVGDVDPEARTVDVQPGLVLGTLQAHAAPHGLRFGPDPSTWSRCTLGGMIGNNACGHRALAFGRTADNLESLDVVDGRGRRLHLSTGLDPVPGLSHLVDGSLGLIRTQLGRFGRQISGYSLEHLLPENGRRLAAAFAGSEGTWGVVVGARVRLVPVPRQPLLVVLGYPDMPSAADAVPGIVGHGAMAIEGLGVELVDMVVAARGATSVPQLPRGRGWLMVEVAADDPAEARARAEAIVRDSGADDARVLPPGREATALWRIREDGAGLAGRSPAGRQAWPGIEDAAVPNERLGTYLRDFDQLMAAHGVHGIPFGHFGDGCVHVRVDFPLETDGGRLLAFMEEAAALIASHGGSLSGEHGDGRARSALLPHMYSAEMLELFGRVKGLFDPEDMLNPGIIVRPRPLDVDLRRPRALPVLAGGGFAFSHDGGDLTSAVHRCVGVGKCRADNTSAGGFMCPSFLATRDEKDSTRGRARVLQEAVSGSSPQWDSPDIAESLDLCLACKACASDCPAGVDMATLKSEALHRRYQRRIRPITHYTLGWLPRWARLASGSGRLVNAVLSVPGVARVVLRAGGMDPARAIPRFASRTFRRWWSSRTATEQAARPRVAVFVDSFTEHFTPEVGQAVVAVLEAAGYAVEVPPRSCCGLTWITTGQLPAARRRLEHLVEVFHPLAAAGIPIVGIEPSCTAVLRSDLPDLLPDDPRARLVSRGVYTLAELLSSPPPLGPGERWQTPDLTGVELVVQPHCHQHAVMGFEADRTLLSVGGATVVELAGCCGLAGSFGMERGHAQVSAAVAENALLPALRASSEGALLVADGFSCRTQAHQLAGVGGQHLAQLFADRLPVR